VWVERWLQIASATGVVGETEASGEEGGEGVGSRVAVQVKVRELEDQKTQIQKDQDRYKVPIWRFERLRTEAERTTTYSFGSWSIRRGALDSFPSAGIQVAVIPLDPSEEEDPGIVPLGAEIPAGAEESQRRGVEERERRRREEVEAEAEVEVEGKRARKEAAARGVGVRRPSDRLKMEEREEEQDMMAESVSG